MTDRVEVVILDRPRYEELLEKERMYDDYVALNSEEKEIYE